jgi:hypothetical protein
MLLMLLHTLGVNKYVVNEDYDKLVSSSINTLFMRFIKYAGALVSPKDITVNSYCP